MKYHDKGWNDLRYEELTGLCYKGSFVSVLQIKKACERVGRVIRLETGRQK